MASINAPSLLDWKKLHSPYGGSGRDSRTAVQYLAAWYGHRFRGTVCPAGLRFGPFIINTDCMSHLYIKLDRIPLAPNTPNLQYGLIGKHLCTYIHLTPGNPNVRCIFSFMIHHLIRKVVPTFRRGGPYRSAFGFSSVVCIYRWCCWGGLNSRPHPYQGCALPLSYSSVYRVRLPLTITTCKRYLDLFPTIG